MLEVKIKSLLEGAKEAKGITVIIDVFRASNNISLVLDKGAKEVIPIADLEESLALMGAHPEYIFMGERDGTKVPEFQYGNSPSEIDKGYFTGKTVSINTTSGTLGIANATLADQLLIGGFANSPAIEEYIKREEERLYDGKNPVVVTLVPIGWAGKTPAFEDEAYAKYLQDRLNGNPTSSKDVIQEILDAEFTERFFDEKDKDFPLWDLGYCLTPGIFNNVPRVYDINGQSTIRDALKYNPRSS
ncbi:MAG: 2-phosphosulfolactate phosphatase [Nanoarchaeota archaeon]|nr:2-phosphosulfolactate phosphatase [Nanoarchaeota archaeon]